MATEPVSILDGVKKVIGIVPNYDSFDYDLLMHINQSFFTLYQLGATEAPFEITDDKTMWDEFPVPSIVSPVKSYLWVVARLQFDSQDRSFVIESLTRAKDELEFRIKMETDRT